MSENRYAGSNGLAAFAGRVGAVFDQSTSVRTIVALALRAWSSTSVRFAFQRKFDVVVEADVHPRRRACDRR